jgi:hypothetical protein
MLGALASPIFGSQKRQNLTVLVLAEQLRAESIDAGWSQFGPGGIRRLAEKGAWFPDCRHLSSTFSFSGIANLATGAWPAQHGIVADTWYDRGILRVAPASEEPLLATTLAAQVAATDPAMRVSVVAMTRAHASLFAGTPAALIYFMDDNGRFSSSGEPPQWMTAYNDSKPLENVHNMPWMALNASQEAPPLRTLTFDPALPQEFLSLYKASPFGQAAVFDFAAELLTREKLGQGSAADFLCIIDGSAARLGYETGGRNPLMNQMVLQLDRRIEALLGQLTRAVGENGFNLVLCAAHGAPPEPPAPQRTGMAVKGELIAQAVERALKDYGRHVEKYVYPFLYLDSFRDSDPVRLIAARAAMAQAAVQDFYTASGVCSVEGEWRKRFQNSFHPKRSGDIMLSYRPEYVEDFNQGRGVSYGSLYDYDAHVPLFFYGPQFRSGIFEMPVEAVDVAPTLARAMGIAVPSSSLGRVLVEAFVS